MKSRKQTFVSFAFIVGFSLLYVSLGLLIWRLGFVPADRSFSEGLIIVLFLLYVFLLPLGLLSSVSLVRAAKKQAAVGGQQKAVELRKRATGSLVAALFDALIGGLGYYLVTRRVFPQIDAIWIFFVLIMLTSGVRVWFSRRQIRTNQQQRQAPT